MNYYEVTFILEPLLPAREVLLAELADQGFESFVETDDGVKGYIQENLFEDALLANLMARNIPDQQFSFSTSLIEDQNWNAEWEKNFDPIIVDDKCLIRAPFHADMPSFQYEINIEPKMSFGTGHHATTHLVISEMMKVDLHDKIVLDMGCGTGVLAILAEKLGAHTIDAIDIDEWAFENTIENIERNGCKAINVMQGGAEVIPVNSSYDVILANINRNILVRDMQHYNSALKAGGTIFFSGFYTMDKSEIDQEAGNYGWQLTSQEARGEWCMLRYEK